MLGKTTVIVLVIRDRRAYYDCHPFLKDKGKGIKDEIGKQFSDMGRI
jgi:hypothetical protein